MRLPRWISQHLTALRAIVLFTALTGIAYPLVILGIAQLPGLSGKADGSLLSANGQIVGSSLIGQAFVDADGNPEPTYFQSRPSASDYNPDATSASNLGPNSIEDTLGDPTLDPNSEDGDGGAPSLLTQVCARSLAVGELEGVSGARPYCTDDGVGAVLRVFYTDGLSGTVTRAVSVNQACPAKPFISTYEGVTVECAKFGDDYSGGVLVPIRGDAGEPEVPADAVTGSGSSLDPHISVDYARLQASRIARERSLTVDQVNALIDQHTTGRVLGFMGEPGVNVLELNLALDRG